jgi:hypothetical protein
MRVESLQGCQPVAKVASWATFDGVRAGKKGPRDKSPFGLLFKGFAIICATFGTRMNVTNIIVYRYRSRFYNTVTYLFIIHPTEATGYHRLNDVTSRHSVSNNLRHRSCILCRPKNFTAQDVRCLM